MAETTSYYEIARNWIERAITDVGITSADKYYEFLRENDLYAPRSIVRTVWREHGEATRYADVIERYNPALPIPRSWIVDSESTAKEPYVARFKISAYDETSKETTTTHLYVTYDRQPNKRVLEEELLILLKRYKPTLDLATLEVKLEGVYHVRGEKW